MDGGEFVGLLVVLVALVSDLPLELLKLALGVVLALLELLELLLDVPPLLLKLL